MNLLRSLLIILFAGLTATVMAASINSSDLPDNTAWYMHADLKKMRATDSAKKLYDWLDVHLVMKAGKEFGIDLSKETDTITAFHSASTGSVIVVRGELSDDAKEKILSLARLNGDVEERAHRGSDYFWASEGDDERLSEGENETPNNEKGSDPLDDFDEQLFFSFAAKNTAIVTANEEQMKAMLESKGRITGSDSHKDAMFVLTADKAFVQAGLNTDVLDDDGDSGWESNIIRNTESAAILISDLDGNVAIEAKLVSTDPKMAESIAGIANGLISLQAFNSDLDSAAKSVLANTKIKVDDNVLSISTVIEPALFTDLLEY